MKIKKLSPGEKAKKTGIWAKTMTKWLIIYSSNNLHRAPALGADHRVNLTKAARLPS